MSTLRNPEYLDPVISTNKERREKISNIIKYKFFKVFKDFLGFLRIY